MDAADCKMTTPPRIVIDRQTSRAEHDRLIAVARDEARRRKQTIRLTRYAMIAFGFVAVAAAVLLAVLAAVGGL